MKPIPIGQFHVRSVMAPDEQIDECMGEILGQLTSEFPLAFVVDFGMTQQFPESDFENGEAAISDLRFVHAWIVLDINNPNHVW